jgi:hypothetical protein
MNREGVVVVVVVVLLTTTPPILALYLVRANPSLVTTQFNLVLGHHVRRLELSRRSCKRAEG